MRCEVASCKLEDFPKFASVQRQLLQLDGASYLIQASLQQTPHREVSCSVRCREATPEEIAGCRVIEDDRQRRDLIRRLSRYFSQFSQIVGKVPEVERRADRRANYPVRVHS